MRNAWWNRPYMSPTSSLRRSSRAMPGTHGRRRASPSRDRSRDFRMALLVLVMHFVNCRGHRDSVLCAGRATRFRLRATPPRRGGPELARPSRQIAPAVSGPGAPSPPSGVMAPQECSVQAPGARVVTGRDMPLRGDHCHRDNTPGGDGRHAPPPRQLLAVPRAGGQRRGPPSRRADARRRLGTRPAPALASPSWEGLHARSGSWPCGVPDGQTPNLFLGLAGTGLFYLRIRRSGGPVGHAASSGHLRGRAPPDQGTCSRRWIPDDPGGRRTKPRAASP